MSRKRLIALLGTADTPTDAVREYCHYLGEALEQEGYELSVDQVGWKEEGYRAAFSILERKAKSWSGLWVLVQYTALAWSSRGFPLRFSKVLKILKRNGVRVAVVYHDMEPAAGTRWIDRIRRRAQKRAMHRGLEQSEVAVLTVPADRCSWLKGRLAHSVFIPVGANLSGATGVAVKERIPHDGRPEIAVYGVTGGRPGAREVQQILEAVRFAASRAGPVRLLVLGRNSRDAETALRQGLAGMPVELAVLGVVPAEQVARSVSGSDVLLFVRGPISSRRGSALAGVACGLPVVACAGPETAPPVTEAGIAFYRPEVPGDLGRVLARVLSDEAYRAGLARQSAWAQSRYFSWVAIARKYAEFLDRER